MNHSDTLVIGAGPGGYVAAIRAAQMGQKVTIIEREYLGGVCSNVGCIPSKVLISVGHRLEQTTHSDNMGVLTQEAKLDWTNVQQFKRRVVSKLVNGVEHLLIDNKINIVKGEAYVVDANTVRVIAGANVQTYTFNNAILATGSRPVELSTFTFSERVINSTDALSFPKIPEKLVVIGGGYIGTELGSAYANLGSHVTIIEGGNDILAGFDKHMTQLVRKSLKKKGVEVVVGASAKGVEEKEKGVIVTYEAEGEEKTVEANYALVTVGRRPNTDNLGLEAAGIELTENGLLKVDKQCRTSVPNFYAIGDIISGPQLAHKASYEGKVAAEAIAGEKSIVDYLAIPAVCFTDPELATVGYNEEQAKTEGIDVKVVKYPIAGNGRALVLNATEGFVKLIARKDDDLLIGAQIVGVNAADTIAEMGVAIEAGMKAEDIALTIHAHPTLSEMTMEAAELMVGQ
ncbi:dihydrolipoyl dehydrogenase [Salipaludibacillus agaradhaerens]|uniref:dihydrolipoyl dehydrogenase n=1 Tax=Salipaludibacillus agaradhaerens TaxID=76935 RepID=UPI000997C02D|nr:dihydrolipoyl dehydrogenase [Salipaludibacillus agaradhaerens]